MKAQNKEEKLAKQQEREKLQREIAAREKAERIQGEYEDRLKKMQADMELRQKALLDAQSTIKLLEDQLKETQVRFLYLKNHQDYNCGWHVFVIYVTFSF